jgi:hypothetical protein
MAELVLRELELEHDGDYTDEEALCRYGPHAPEHYDDLNLASYVHERRIDTREGACRYLNNFEYLHGFLWKNGLDCR